MYTIAFTCPDCGYIHTKESPVPPKAAFAMVPNPVLCPRCGRDYPRAWLTQHQLLTVRIALS